MKAPDVQSTAEFIQQSSQTCDLQNQDLLLPGSQKLLEDANDLGFRDRVNRLMQVVRANVEFGEYNFKRPNHVVVNCVGAAFTASNLMNQFGIDTLIGYPILSAYDLSIARTMHVVVIALNGSELVVTDPTPLAGYGFGQTSQSISEQSLNNDIVQIDKFDPSIAVTMASNMFPIIKLLTPEELRYIDSIWVGDSFLADGLPEKAYEILQKSDISLYEYDNRRLRLVAKALIQLGYRDHAIELYERIIQDPTCKLKYLKEYLQLKNPDSDPKEDQTFIVRARSDREKSVQMEEFFLREKTRFQVTSPLLAHYFSICATSIGRRLGTRKLTTVESLHKELTPRRYSFANPSESNPIFKYEETVFQNYADGLLSNIYLSSLL